MVAVVTATIRAFRVTPTVHKSLVGSWRYFKALATYSDERVEDLTEKAIWSSSNESVATVSNLLGARGAARALAAGNAKISASFAGLENRATLEVDSMSTFVRLEIEPRDAQGSVGEIFTFKSTLVFPDGTREPIGAWTFWSSSNPLVANIGPGSAQGATAACNAAGVVMVTATARGSATQTSLTCTSPADKVPLALQITPNEPEIFVGASLQFQLVGLFADGSLRDLTREASWSAPPSGIVQLQSAGRVVGVTPGSDPVRASIGSLSTFTKVTVRR